MFVFVGYESLQDRKEIREAAWRRPGWDECVAYTGLFLLNSLLYCQFVIRKELLFVLRK